LLLDHHCQPSRGSDKRKLAKLNITMNKKERADRYLSPYQSTYFHIDINAIDQPAFSPIVKADEIVGAHCQ